MQLTTLTTDTPTGQISQIHTKANRFNVVHVDIIISFTCCTNAKCVVTVVWRSQEYSRDLHRPNQRERVLPSAAGKRIGRSLRSRRQIL